MKDKQAREVVVLLQAELDKLEGKFRGLQEKIGRYSDDEIVYRRRISINNSLREHAHFGNEYHIKDVEKKFWELVEYLGLEYFFEPTRTQFGKHGFRKQREPVPTHDEFKEPPPPPPSKSSDSSVLV